VGMILTEGCITSLMLFLNYETMTCNVFELLNIVIGLVITFRYFLLNFRKFNEFYLTKTRGSVSPLS
jgi:hypothetical protein